MDESIPNFKKLEWDIEDWVMDRNYFRNHLIETRGPDGLSSWRKISRAPSNRQLYQANRVIIENADGSYHYIKNRSGYIGPVPEQELIWILLNV